MVQITSGILASLAACISIGSIDVASAQKSIPEILRTVYDNTDGRSWHKTSGWDREQPDSYCNDWAGIKCYDVEEDDQLYGHIEILNLSKNRLIGQLPSDIFAIPHLSHLILRDNPDLIVTFDGIERATELKRLVLSKTRIEDFSGIEKASHTLNELHITACGYEGEFPEQIAQLSKLKGLFSNYNQIKGTIPDSIGNMTSLEKLYLYQNEITGSIPSTLGDLFELRAVVLGNNWISGEIPESMNQLQNLEILSLAENQLKGNVPSFDLLKSISEIYLENNNLEGVIPLDFLFNAPKQNAITIDLSDNQIGGKFWGYRLKEFEYMNLYLSGNKFTELDQDLCTRDAWESGNVDTYGCNAIMCPVGFYAPKGRQTSDNDVCRQCDSDSLGEKYMGAYDCGNEQKNILKGFYDVMGGDNWDENNWLSTEDECEWSGISCDEIGNIIAIEMPDFGLTGTPSYHIFLLPELRVLDLSDNFIKFKFDGIFEAKELRELNLFDTGLDSLEDIEQLQSTSLTRLVLSSNSIAEEIPSVFWDLTSLEELAISHNRFYGELSEDIGNLMKLRTFHAFGNKLSGEIPYSIVNLQHVLEDLVLSENNFSGEIPEGMSNMHRLKVLSIHQTTSIVGGLTGALPDFAKCYDLAHLHLSGNSITGELPETFLESSNYLNDEKKPIVLDLSSNYLFGRIPKSWDRFNYINIDLSNNQIDGIPQVLCGNDGWQEGYLGQSNYDCDYILCDKKSYNALGRATLSVPCSYCESADYFGATTCQNENSDNLAILENLYASTAGDGWKSSHGWFTSNDVCDDWHGIYCDDDGIDIVRIDLSNNLLTGTPSPDIFNLPKLQELSLEINAIDFSFDGIEAAVKLEVLYLSVTRISSLDGIGKAKSLKELHLTECYLSGPIPSELFSLTNLESLFLNFNNFSGRIPRVINQLVNLKKLYLTKNQLSGPIPAAIGQLKELRVLSLTDNSFSGSIPDELNELKNLEILAIEHERKNLPTKLNNGRRTQQGFGLTGKLPAFDGLPNLKELLLGYNSLTGSIPYNFVEGIADKTQPLLLDLQFNLFEGNVPSSLTQFDKVQISLQGNKFTGIAPGLCSMTEWNNGDVKTNKCDAILCPTNTYASLGRYFSKKDSKEDCVQCPAFTASLYLGAVECVSETDQFERDEKKILQKVYESLQGNGWYSQQHWYDEDISFCEWFGITCAPGEVDSVEAIRLPSNGLAGHVPNIIFDLPNLQELNLGGNTIFINFNGIEKASKLQFINLDGTGITRLTGIEASPSLKMLHAASNKFDYFPLEVLQLTNLEVLYLSYNKFRTLPDLSVLTHLAFFQCKECALAGDIPNWLGKIKTLQYLSLPGNMLTGVIPSEFSELELLEHLDLSEQTPRGGGLTGGLPAFDTLINLSNLFLHRNKLSGEISESFLKKVDSYTIAVDLRYNELTGAVPESFLDRFDEFTLFLAENKIDSIPCDDSYDLEWNDGDVREFGCDAILCAPGSYSPIGRKSTGRAYDCVPCNSGDIDEYYGSTTCGIIPDKVALEAIYNALGGPDWNNNELWMENDIICEWYGVTCDDNGNKRVTGLDLQDNNLLGDLPTEMFDLSELKSINLKKNKEISISFSGIEKLTNLQSLNLSDMGFVSVEGLNAASSLKVLHLTGNALKEIPEEIYDLVNLEEIYMNYNRMEGQISPKIGQLAALRELYMFRNKLSGSLPAEIGQLQELRTLGLGENSFSGTLPTELNNLPKVEVIALQHSRISSQAGPGAPLTLDRGDVVGFTGKLPAFDNSPRLTELYLGYNDFLGSIPTNFLDAVGRNSDIIVDLTMNHITGSLPSSLQKFNYMTIYLAGNEIESLDEAFCDLETWMGGEVEKSGCDAILCPTGTANEYGRQTNAGPVCKACAFTFSAPYYGSGECMADIKDYNEKEILELLYDTTGGNGWSKADNWKDDSISICDWHGIHCLSEEVDGAAPVVKEINLPSNRLSGTIPPQVFSLKHLKMLNIRENKVDIQLSSLRDNIYALESMYLDDTLISSFTGIGMLKNLKTLHLQQNNFLGSPMPEELFTLSKLKHLYVSDSNIGGELPPSIGNLFALEDFYSHKNELTGEIPTEIALLENMETLVLSENRFVGPLPDLSSMISLQSLLLDSFTRRGAGLSGPVPSFDGMPSLREIYLNENSFTGSITHNFLGGISDTHETIKVGLKGNRIEGTLPGSLKHFRKLDIDLADNLITNIHPDLCTNDYWMAGYVETYRCDAILCPAGYYNQFGRQDNALVPCKKCSGDEQSVYLGATKCKAEVKKREREILEIFYNSCGGSDWKNKENWLKPDADICHWYGIQCNDEGSIDSILLGSNNLSGKTPRELFELKSLKWLWLYSNPIDFSFHGIGEASSLSSLLLDSTGLSSLDGVGQAYQLVDLEVRFNRLSGPIPEEMARLVNLETLSMSDNDFTGPIPSFTRLHRLKSLRISNNKLSGELPNFASNSKLHTIDLSNNRIAGSIPSTFLASISTDETIYIDLAKNQIEGDVPAALNRFDKMTLYLRDNFITGLNDDLCANQYWNDGDVGKFECNAILCPVGTYAPGRGRESPSSECLPCDKAKYYGQSECILRTQSSAPSRSKLIWTFVLTSSISIGMLM